MWRLLLSCLAGCSHRRTTFPLAARRSGGHGEKLPSYVVCLDCGNEFEYDWQQMRIRKSAIKTVSVGKK